MEFADVVRRQRMVCSFTAEPVAPDAVERILDAARRGPSAGFSQGTEFVVVTDDATLSTHHPPGQHPRGGAPSPAGVAG
jgi:nitroreductase